MSGASVPVAVPVAAAGREQRDAGPSLAAALAQLSVIRIHGSHEDGHCGYCNGQNGSKTTYGITAERLSTLDYQALCDQGWRRSGTYLYKPGTNICCPQNTIRLDVNKFEATKQQRRVVKRFNEFLRGERDLLNEKGAEDEDEDMRDASQKEQLCSSSNNKALPALEQLAADLSSAMTSCMNALYGSSVPIKGPFFVPHRAATATATAAAATAAAAPSPGTHSAAAVPALFSAVALQVRAALARQAGVVKTRPKPGQAGPSHDTSGDTAAQTAVGNGSKLRQQQAGTAGGAAASLPAPSDIAHALVAALGQHPALLTRLTDISLCVAPSQGHIHVHVLPGSVLHATMASTHSPSAAAPPAVRVERREVTTSTGTGTTTPAVAAVAEVAASPYPTHSFRVDMVPAAFDQASFKLWQKYQQAVHGDALSELDKGHYTRFLCTHPLLREPQGAPYGSCLGQVQGQEQQQLTEQQAALAARLAEACKCPVEQAGRAVLDALQLQGQQPGGPSASSTGVGRTGVPEPNAALKLLLQDMSAKASGISWAGSSSQGQCLSRAAGSASRGWVQGEGAGQGVPLLAAQATTGRLPAGVITGFGQLQQERAPATAGGDAARDDSKGAPPPFIFSDVLSAATAGTDLSQGYGAFHQRYYLDGKLIAVGVVDVLPLCLSSVYVFYDPELGRTLQLGKLTALREIQWVQAVCRSVSPRLCWYYMGFYVRSCVKMRYKGEYAPSDVRCPVTGQWVPLLQAGPLLDEEERQAAGGKGAKAGGTGGGSKGGGSSSSSSGKRARGGPLVSAAVKAAWDEGQKLRDATLAASIARVPLLLSARGHDSGNANLGPGVSDLCTIRELTEQGKGIVKPMLLELLQRTGTELGTRMVVKL